MKRYLPLLLLLTTTIAFSQPGKVKTALKHLEKQRYDKMEKGIAKGLKKDSAQAGLWYVSARLYFAPASPYFHIDSAYAMTQKAILLFDSADTKSRAALQKNSINRLTLLGLRQSIDSAAFDRARLRATEESYNDFILRFSTARQRPEAIQLRNQVAFANALRVDTYEAYKQFIDTYPEAPQVEQARERFELLYFRERTRDGSLQSFVTFIQENPQSPYRLRAEREVFEISTADHRPDSYLSFIRTYPTSPFSERALGVLYHLSKALGTDFKYPGLVSDSLSQLIKLNSKRLVPFYRAGTYGFMDETGQEWLAADYDHILPEYLCRVMEDDWLYVNKKGLWQFIDRSGHPFLMEEAEHIEDLGNGVLLLETAGVLRVVHKAGFEIPLGEIDDIKWVDNRYLAFEKDGKWGLATVSGRILIKPELSQVTASMGILALTKSGKVALIKAGELWKKLTDKGKDLTWAYDEWRLVQNQWIWVRTGQLQGLLDLNLNWVLHPAPVSIREASNGYLLHDESGLRFYQTGIGFLHGRVLAQTTENHHWLAVKEGGKWELIRKKSGGRVLAGADSIRLFGNHFALTWRNDSLRMFTQADKSLLLKGFSNPRAVIAPWIADLEDRHAEFMWWEHREGWRLFNTQGKEIFKGKADAFTAIGEEYLVVERNGKKYVHHADGRQLSPLKLDAVGNYNQGYISLLLDKKFGIFSLRDTVHVAPKYSKNIIPYSSRLLVAARESLYGFIDKKGKELTPFEFEEIRYWNDTVALVRNHAHWMLWDIRKQVPVVKEIKTISYIRQSKEESIAMILTNTGYGIMSSRKGEVIPPVYSEIINMGSDTSPFYFAEKHIEEADFFVVIYYDARGEIIMKQAFELKDYERVFCDN